MFRSFKHKKTQSLYYVLGTYCSIQEIINTTQSSIGQGALRYEERLLDVRLKVALPWSKQDPTTF